MALLFVLHQRGHLGTTHCFRSRWHRAGPRPAIQSIRECRSTPRNSSSDQPRVMLSGVAHEPETGGRPIQRPRRQGTTSAPGCGAKSRCSAQAAPAGARRAALTTVMGVRRREGWRDRHGPAPSATRHRQRPALGHHGGNSSSGRAASAGRHNAITRRSHGRADVSATSVTGRLLIPLRKFEWTHWVGPVTSIRCTSERRARSAAPISTRPRWAPRQKCGP